MSVCLQSVFRWLVCTGAVVFIIIIIWSTRSRYTASFSESSKTAQSRGWVSIATPLFEDDNQEEEESNISTARENISTSRENIRENISTARENFRLGEMDYDIWHWMVGYLVDDMRIVREFPSYPDERKTSSQLHNEFSEVDSADVRGHYAHKMYGYLIPPGPGSYSFKVDLTSVTASVSVEIWISLNTDPYNMSRVLDLTYENNEKKPITRSAESIKLSLMSEAHYFEFLEKAYEGKVVADVKWKTPSSNEYVSIPSKNIALYSSINNSSVVPPLLAVPLPSSELQKHHRVQPIWNTIRPITDLPILPDCKFYPFYAQPRKVKKYAGYKQVHETGVYPPDNTSYKNPKKKGRGNPVVSKNMVDKVVELYSKALSAYKVSMGAKVLGLHYLEETVNKVDGSRFLLEMEVQLPSNESVYTSEYVYLKKDSSTLCHTSNFQWTKNVDVHFVVSVKNLGLWVKHLIYNMEDIYAQTEDEHFSLIIVDYESEDMDIEGEAKRSSFKRIKVINMKGKFSRSSGLQAGIDYVTNKSSIVMTIDMHLTFPPGIVEYARKHTVQYKMAFTPMFFRLNKGHTEINYNGFWEIFTYGLFAMYKSDWITSGGFSTLRYLYKWGGEDWDMLDKALAKGIEAFRIRPPGLVHYHHTKKGMWGNSEIKFTEKWILH